MVLRECGASRERPGVRGGAGSLNRTCCWRWEARAPGGRRTPARLTGQSCPSALCLRPRLCAESRVPATRPFQSCVIAKKVSSE